MAKITRRQLMLAGSVGAAAVAAGGGAWVLACSHETFVAGMVGHALKSEPIAAGALEEFAFAYLKGDAEDPVKVEALMQIQRIIGYPGLDAMLADNQAFEHFKRRVTTAFMLSSTFFYRTSPGEPVAFTGLAGVCNNPFARFD